MMLELLYGRPGTGKSTYIISRIIASLRAGGRPVLIVPEQEAVEAERRVTDAAGGNGAGDGVPTVGLDVINFSRLANLVFRRVGGLAYDYPSPGAMSLAMWRALTESADKLTEYGRQAASGDRAFVTLLLQTHDSLKLWNLPARSLSDAADALDEYRGAGSETGAETETLKHRLRDIAAILSRYDEILAQKYTDPADDMARLAAALDSCGFFAGREVYIDSFTSFAPAQYEVLRRVIAEAPLTAVALDVDRSNTQDAFETLRKTAANLTAIARDAGAQVQERDFRTVYRYKTADLAALGDHLWDFDSGALDCQPESIHLAECGDVYSEAEYAAQNIRRAVEGGARYRDFALIARDVHRYEGVLDMVFEKYGIPYFMSRTVPLSSRPVIRLIMSAMSVISFGWREADVISYLKTGLAGLDPDEINDIENYAYFWNINGKRWYDDRPWSMNPAGYTETVSDFDKALLERVNALRERVREPLMKLQEGFKGDVRSASAAVYAFLTELKAGVNAGSGPDAQEAEQTWDHVMDSLDSLVAVAGDMTVKPSEYSNLFLLVVGDTEYGRIPATFDEVTVGAAPMIRVEDKKYVYILGANETVFPQAVKSSQLFYDSDLSLLREIGLELPFDMRRDERDELLFFYSAVSSPSDSLTITWASADPSGAQMKPSMAVSRINTLFPEIKTVRTSEIPDRDRVLTLPTSFEYLNTPDSELGDALAAAYLACPDPKYLERYKASFAPVCDRRASCGKTERRSLPLNQTKLDTYALCPYSYACRFSLRLKESRRATFRAADVGTFIHYILQMFFSDLSSERRAHPEKKASEIYGLDDAAIDAKLDAIIADYLDQTVPDPRDRGGRLESLVKRMRRNARLLIRNLLEEFSQSEFQPRFFELPINSGGEQPSVRLTPLPLPDGGSAYITGRIDRVDTYKNGNRLYVRVVDYKTGEKDFSLADIELGLNLQMLLYLYAVWNDDDASFRSQLGAAGGDDVMPAGILYFTARPPRPISHGELGEDDLMKKLARKGVVLSDEEVRRAMDRELSGRYIPVKPRGGAAWETNIPYEDLEEFGALMRHAMDCAAKLAAQIRSGRSDISPLRDSRHDACRYCVYKPCCRASASDAEPEAEDEADTPDNMPDAENG